MSKYGFYLVPLMDALFSTFENQAIKNKATEEGEYSDVRPVDGVDQIAMYENSHSSTKNHTKHGTHR